MNTTTIFKKNLALLILLANAFILQSEEINFNKSWKFLKNTAEGAEKQSYSDSNWRVLDLPHDWAIEGPFNIKHNARTGGLPVDGTGWYRKHFVMPQSAKAKVVRLEFEGAMYDANLWVNGSFVGNRPYGYIGFEFDISSYLKFDGTDNVVAVRLTPKDFSSRWYPGAGIYRSVWMHIDEPVYVSQWGTFISTPTVTTEKAVVQNETVIENKSDKEVTVTLKHDYFSPDDKWVAAIDEKLVIPAKSNKTSGLYCNITKPERWDLNTPNLYKSVTTISENSKILDTYVTKFGIRSISFDTNGFYLNERKVRFNGVCLHHDNGALGAAVNRRADERKLQIMKDMGVNAIRTSHNPPSRELLELCDEMGLLVMDEAFDVWEMPKVENGYNVFFREWSERDIKDMIRRDRNHPSIVMWSIGNEIMEQPEKKLGWKQAKRLHDFCKEMDKTRPTVCGFNYYPAPFDFNMAQQIDIAGMNYKPAVYDEVRRNYPQLPIIGSETSSCVSSRGEYHFPVVKYDRHDSKQVTSYDMIGPSWAYPPDIEFHFLKKNEFVMGEFIWTGFDYLGEPTPYGGNDNVTDGLWNSDWPSRSSYFGAVDLCGFPKDRFYIYQSQWTTKPMIHLLPHWNWAGMEGQTIPVYCYTNCDEAELFLNGKSVGRKVKGIDKTTLDVDFRFYDPKKFESEYRLSWHVPYQAGTLKVVGYKNGKAITEKTITTAGKPAKIELTADRSLIQADGQDLSYITVRILDKDGNFCPMADNLVDFEVKGDGIIAGVDNGDAISVDSFQEPNRKAYNGMCLAILKATEKSGLITLQAKSKGLKNNSISIQTKK